MEVAPYQLYATTVQESYEDGYRTAGSREWDYNPGGPWVCNARIGDKPDFVAYCKKTKENNLAWKNGFADGQSDKKLLAIITSMGIDLGNRFASYERQAERDWFDHGMRFGDAEEIKSALAWCEENTSGDWIFNLHFSFEKDDDATLFKIAFPYREPPF